MYYCFYCMGTLTEDVKLCPICGHKTKYESLSHHLSVGTLLNNKFLVGRVIGEGGFGITYIGRDLTLNAKIAIKEYYPKNYATRNNSTVTISKDGKGEYFANIKQLLNEAQILATFSRHSNIVSVREYFEENSTAYIIMEYLDGINLEKYLETNGKQDAVSLVNWFKPLLKTLEKVHKEGLIHRDIAPTNIIVENNTLVLIDFGAAREIDPDNSLSVILKKGYSPAEQYSSHGNQGPWTDIYAICATMYRAITGSRPPEASERVLKDELIPPSKTGIQIPEHIEKALMKGLSNRYEERQQNIGELIADLTSSNTDVSMSVNVNMVTERTETETIYEDDKKKDMLQTIKIKESNDIASITKENLKLKLCIGVLILLVLLFMLLFLLTLPKDSNNEESETSTIATIESEENAVSATNEVTTVDNSDKIAQIILDAEQAENELGYQVSLDKINDGLAKYPDSEELQNKKLEYTSIIFEQEKAQQKADILAKSEEYAISGDYLGAFQYINDFEMSDDIELSAKMSEYEIEYINQAISEADALVAESKYDEAIKVLNNTKAKIHNISDIERKIAEIEDSKPVSLEPYENPYCDKYVNEPGNTFTMMGIEYSDGVVYNNSVWTTEGYSLYNLQDKYSKVEFDVGHVDDSSRYEKMLYVYIYVDDNEECVQTVSLLGDMVTQHIVVPVENAKRIKINFGYGYAIANVKGYK